MNYPYYNNQLFNAGQQMQPAFQPIQSGMQQNVQVQQDERIWVQGIEGANAYLVAPNSFVRLWDSQANVFYEKHTDASGRPFTEIFEYKKKSDQKPQVGNTDSLESKISDLEKRIFNLENKGKGVKKNESIADDTTI